MIRLRFIVASIQKVDLQGSSWEIWPIRFRYTGRFGSPRSTRRARRKKTFF